MNQGEDSSYDHKFSGHVYLCVHAVNLDSDGNFAEALEANVNVSHLRVVKPGVAA